MAQLIEAVRGMNDIGPDESAPWQYVEQVFRELMLSYGYHEVRLPLVEKTELFKRSIGEVTDIVEKEMYTFEDRNGESLSLRPEGTAGCVRAALQRGWLHQPVQRLWYGGPMFRHERPQKGRYRQFHQLGVEVFGLPGPDIDAENIIMTARLWRRLGVADKVRLQINSLGTPRSRARFRTDLVAWLQERAHLLDEDSRRRLSTNPLRILDSKVPETQRLLAGAPSLMDYLDGAARAHFAELCARLDAAGVAWEHNPRLVRGLDYYTYTVFEWITGELGAQGTVCAGGRYDGLVEQLGGKPTPAVGFALGMERLVALLPEGQVPEADYRPQAYLVMVGEAAEHRGQVLAESLRDALPGLRLLAHCGGGSFKSQLKRADRSGALVALILGEAEAEAGTVGLKPLRGGGEQETVPQAQAAQKLAALLHR